MGWSHIGALLDPNGHVYVEPCKYVCIRCGLGPHASPIYRAVEPHGSAACFEWGYATHTMRVCVCKWWAWATWFAQIPPFCVVIIQASVVEQRLVFTWRPTQYQHYRVVLGVVNSVGLSLCVSHMSHVEWVVSSHKWLV